MALDERRLAFIGGGHTHELLSEASTPGGISAESVFTLEQYAFRAALSEAIYNATLKAAEFSDANQKT